jgi:hypothetical protein
MAAVTSIDEYEDLMERAHVSETAKEVGHVLAGYLSYRGTAKVTVNRLCRQLDTTHDVIDKATTELRAHHLLGPTPPNGGWALNNPMKEELDLNRKIAMLNATGYAPEAVMN